MSKDKQDYPCIQAWDRMMGSFSYYTEQQKARARDANAPQDAIYERTGYDRQGNWRSYGWARLPDVTSVETQWYFQQNHRELVEQFAPEWLKKDEQSNAV